MNRPAAGEPDRKCVVVGVAERDDTAFPLAGEDLHGLLHHGTLNAPARDRTRHFPGIAHGHRRSGIARTRPFRAHDARNRNAMAVGTPPLDVVQYLFHFDITSVSSSNAASEWP